ncbi:hypothetical protein CES86_0686 [Brucella lupini]|uniref:Uncharacterized protein n=1 Tax=Brucella lupini TaxID=255457 RepID=A0A256GXK6_9HYPH|nr:hypothetical protein CES86_0686 [Brucella lupini]
MDRRRHTASQRLQPLRPTNFASVVADRRIVGHVLRLKRPNIQAAIARNPA